MRSFGAQVDPTSVDSATAGVWEQHYGGAGLETAVRDAGRLVPHERRAAVAGLTGERGCHDVLRPDAGHGVTAIIGPRARRSGTGHGAGGARTAHLIHRRV
jgi:hypothetical protein